MKSADVNSNSYILTLVKKLIFNILNFKFVMVLEYQNIKTFFQKAMF